MRFTAWIRKNLKLVALLTAGAVGLVAVETALIAVLMPESPVKWYLLGVLHAAIAGALVYLLNSAFVAHDREAILHLRGAGARRTPAANLNGHVGGASSGVGWTA